MNFHNLNIVYIATTKSRALNVLGKSETTHKTLWFPNKVYIVDPIFRKGISYWSQSSVKPNFRPCLYTLNEHQY